MTLCKPCALVSANFEKNGQLTPYDDDDLESVPSLASSSSKSSGYEPWEPYGFLSIPEDVVIEEWITIGAGIHGQVRRVLTTSPGKPRRFACVKLFTAENFDAYIREVKAYMYLRHRRVQRCVPIVYFKQEWPRWKWDGNQPDDYTLHDRDEMLYGIFMEYFEDFEAVNLSKASVRLAEVMGQTLEMIHGTGVVHGDIAERNILLVRENGMVRVVWIDFSCAWAGRQYLDTATDMEWNKFRDLLDKGMVLSFSL
jgi:hypothetical protein